MPPKLNQEGINHLNRSITQNKIEASIKSLPEKKSPGLDGFSAEFCQTFKEDVILTFFKVFHKIKREGILPMKPVLHSSPNHTKTHTKRRTIG
jgi:hypothetical protein